MSLSKDKNSSFSAKRFPQTVPTVDLFVYVFEHIQ